MGFLQQFLNFRKICIQCHNNPDADTLASAFGLYCYLTDHGADVDIIYSGPDHIRKFNTNYMIKECGIPIRYADDLPETDLLIVVDGQYGAGNVEKFQAPEIAVIDHHICMTQENEKTLIKSHYQSCSTIVWELLVEEGYPVEENKKLCVALLYGLYTDTSSYSDLYQKRDLEMKIALSGEYPLFEKLAKSSMTIAELLIAGDALQYHYFDPIYHYAIVSAIRCDQAILGIISDLMIRVDVILVNLAYTTVNGGYQMSIRSCDEKIPANLLADNICRGIGSGGGHAKKAGGRVSSKRLKDRYGEEDFFEFLNRRMNEFISRL